MKSSIIFLSFLMAGMLFANAVLADPQIQVSSSVNPTPIAPGNDGYVQLTFTNTGTSAANSIQIIGINPDSNLKISSGMGNIGALGNGQSTTTLVKFSVLNTASSGLYTIRFVVNYCTSSCNEIDPTVIITVQAPSTLQVSSVQPDTLAAGQTATLNFNLANEGSDAINNVVMTWQTPNNEILPLGISNRQYISSIGGAQSLIIPVNVAVGSSVSPGVYPLTIQLVYYDKSGVKQNTTSSIGIKIGGTTDFDVSVQQYSAGTLSLSIANVGVNPATSVSVDIPDQSDFVVSGANSVFLGTLNSGDFSIANFQITSRFAGNQNGFPRNSTAGASNTLTLEISYSDTSGARQTAKKEVTLNLASTQTSTVQRSQGFGSRIVEIAIVAIIIVIAAVILWYFKFRKKKSLSDMVARILHKFKK